MATRSARISDRLKEARGHAHMTQQQLADALGVTLRGVQGWEGGQREPSFNTLRRLSEVLAVSQAWLLGEVDDSATRPEGRLERLDRMDRLAAVEAQLAALTTAVEEVLRRLPPVTP